MSGRRGPIGGLIGLIGQGVGVAAEYHEHRKERKLSRQSSSQPQESSAAGPSSSFDAAGELSHSQADVPPAYADASTSGFDRTLHRGPPPTASKKAAIAQDDYSSDSDDSSDLQSMEDDEEDWRLDEAVEDTRGLPSYEESETEYRTTDQLVHDILLVNQAAAEKPKAKRPLPYPVILPQRRPRKKARGFVRAYAPVLDDCGIDQETFLKFLDNFQKSSQASPVFKVIQVSAGIAGFAPSVIAMAVTTAVQIAAGVGEEIQARQRTNEFLDRMNDELFKPAGLFAFIMKYQTDAEVSAANSKRPGLVTQFIPKPQVVDLSSNQIVAKYYRSASDDSDTHDRSMTDRLKDIRLASGTTQGSIRMPEAAPLIFPDLDKALVEDGVEDTFKSKTADAKAFLADYIDRRAHFRYAHDDPMSKLVVPEDQRAFKSKLADPNHPAFQGGIVTLLTGGMLPGRPDRRTRRSERQFERDERKVLRYEQRMARGRGLTRKQQMRFDAVTDERVRRGMGDVLDGPRDSAVVSQGSQGTNGISLYHGTRGQRHGGGGPIGAVKRIMREDVLYLMIVNLPSEAELTEARDQLERQKRK
ncbi:hypothetical protein D0869_03447 [Hortaea werneckii]|uniref:Uncharacterized protein n=1 Tax=Hortaea werneckii TaxID=91943 RepID=A0A3M7BGE0_HORWE|nr:hypothetical protein KC334_g4058 [Hortaea werneckii]KAI7203079.1 hypothetical protein KC324_g1443 [Hortaea werneckii]KAI7593499.1 hypothetical protein KC316_g1693 [Hortaea werneckii]KAI7670832.1 hypothetical protein KC318_g3830 [Hortaea werneckii]RMX85954.1 hypothetical protein D0869_03447 [Hortaea werneckii]